MPLLHHAAGHDPTAAPPLTAVTIRNLKAPATGRLDVPDGGTPGLCLRITSNDVRTWTLRMRDGAGELRRITLGPLNDTQGLAWARKEADRMRQDVRHNRRDPKRERAEAIKAAHEKDERDRLTLGVLVGEWRRLKLSNRTSQYAAEAERALSYAFKAQWNRAATDLDRKAVARVLAGCRPVMASRTVAYGRACFQWAAKRDLIASNPFAGHDVAPATERERFLSGGETVEAWRASLADPGVFGPIVRLLILTGQRREEVAGMDWNEVSADLTTWTIPGARTKNGKPQIVPLSDLAQAQLPPRAKGSVFPGEARREGATFCAWSRAKARLNAAIAEARADAARQAGAEPKPFLAWTLHDLRRTCATGLQGLKVPLEVTEAVLNHTSGSRAGIVGTYQRHAYADEKREALNIWAKHVGRLLSGEGEASNVVPLVRVA